MRFQDVPYSRPELLADGAWLDRARNDSRVRIVDLRPAKAYAAGHIPGAVRLDDGPLRNPEERFTYLPRPEVFARQLGDAGIDNRSEIVIYDEEGCRHAARLWYVLNAFGHSRVRLLDGGWRAWTAQSLPTATDTPSVAPTRFRVRTVPNLTCPLPQLLNRKPGVVVLDARSDAEYDGKALSPGAKAAGRIPGAVHVEWKENVTGPNLVFKSAAELRALYAAKGVTPDKEIVVYCASGGRAAQSLFALTLIGYRKVRVYYGSFGDYTGLPDAPIEK